MTDGWLEIDDVPRDELPEWARAETRRSAVAMSEHGVAWLDRDRGSVARWTDVLGVAVIASERWMPHAFVLVPRSPPRPPWFPVTIGMLPADMAARGLDSFATMVRQRATGWTYRKAATDRPRMPPGELKRRVLARQEVPGAVEVPVGFPPGAIKTSGTTAIVGTLMGAGLAAYAGFCIGAPLAAALAAGAGETALAIAGGITGLASFVGGGMTFGSILPKRTKRKDRVLVLAPDGCVAGFHDGVHAIAWEEVDRFEIGELDERPCLSVIGCRPGQIGQVDANWFSEPLELIVAVAEAYRKRATATPGM